MAYLLLAIVELIGLALIPFGLPGLWLQVGALALFAWSTGFVQVGTVPLLVALVLAVSAEIMEFLLGARYARRYGGGRRAAVGAVVGGIVGAVVGLPLPLLGSVFGALAGAFVGAAALELTTGRGAGAAARAGWGAMLGRIVATTMKGAVGVVLLVYTLYLALR